MCVGCVGVHDVCSCARCGVNCNRVSFVSMSLMRLLSCCMPAGNKTPAATLGGPSTSTGARTPFSDEKEVKVTGSKAKASGKKAASSKSGGSSGAGADGVEAEIAALAKAKVRVRQQHMNGRWHATFAGPVKGLLSISSCVLCMRATV